MLSPRLTLLLATGFIMLLPGCATTDDSPVAGSYQAPAAELTTAFLKGSRISEEGMFGNDHTGFVALIDLKPVPGAANKWSAAIALTPGQHTITAGYRCSNFMARAYLPLDFRAGVTYQLMIKPGHENTLEGKLFCEFWVVDLATGKSVTTVHHVQVTGGQKGTIFRVPV